MRIKAGNTLTEELHTLVLPTGYAVDATDRYGSVTGGYIVIPFSHAGDVAVAAGASQFPVPFDSTIVGVRAAVGTAPIGAAMVCDVNKNGASVFVTTGNRPSIADGDVTTTVLAVPDTTALAAGDLLSVDVDQVGSSVAGSDLVVVVLLQGA